MALTWTLEVTPTTSGYKAVCWSPELGIFVAGGGDGTHKFATSPDGVVWTDQDFVNVRNAAGIVWSRTFGVFVAISSSASTQCVMTSPDGMTWTLQAATPYGAVHQMRAIVGDAVGNVLVAVGDAGQAMYSLNGGVAWSASAGTPDATSNWQSVTYDAALAKFVAVSNSGDIRIMTSPDGINWTGRMGFQVAFEKNWSSVASTGNGQLVAVANYDANITTLLAMTSSDGVNWTVQSTPAFTVNGPTKGWRGVAYSPSYLIFVAVGDQGTGNGISNQEVMYSRDNGVTWTLSDAADNTLGWGGSVGQPICWSPALSTFVACRAGGNGSINNIMGPPMVFPLLPVITRVNLDPTSTIIEIGGVNLNCPTVVLVNGIAATNVVCTGTKIIATVQTLSQGPVIVSVGGVQFPAFVFSGWQLQRFDIRADIEEGL